MVGEREIEKYWNTDRIGGGERKIVAQTGVRGEREREREAWWYRERHGGIERKIKTQTGVGEREIERQGGREKKSKRRT